MHKLVRSYPEPQVLAEARQNGVEDWDHFPSAKKKEVQLDLLVMQDERCAYCESALDLAEGHIEHFRRKNKDWFPELTFVWDNLYYSCMGNGTCGCHKDRVLEKDQVDMLIDPCKDNPEDYLVFTPDGEVNPRPALSESDRARAELTIDVFNLRHPALCQKRANEIRKYAWMRDSEYSSDEIDEYLALTKIDQYVTAICHSLGKRVVA